MIRSHTMPTGTPHRDPETRKMIYPTRTVYTCPRLDLCQWQDGLASPLLPGQIVAITDADFEMFECIFPGKLVETDKPVTRKTMDVFNKGEPGTYKHRVKHMIKDPWVETGETTEITAYGPLFNEDQRSLYQDGYDLSQGRERDPFADESLHRDGAARDQAYTVDEALA